MSENKWYKEWFDTPYYHRLYAHRNETEAQAFIEKLVKHTGLPTGSKVLDAACGKGRHSRTLANMGMNVTGIDLSEKSIAEANSMKSENLKFDVWDIRETYKEHDFDMVVNLFSSFGYFDRDEEDYSCIQAFFDCLNQNGKLVIDYINTEWAVKQLKTREIVPREEIQFHIEKKIEAGFIHKKIDFIDDGEAYSFTEKLKLINRHRFNHMLSHCGFNIRDTFGDYSLNAFHPSSSPRLIIIAEKL